MMKTLLVALLAVAGASAQTFEVATIKPNSASDHRVGIRIAPGGNFTASGVPVRVLIGMAYDLRDFQIQGLPGWAGADRYDISAKAPDSLGGRISMEQIRPMLKALLEERFQLKAHLEKKEGQVYTLQVAKGGVKMAVAEAGGERQQMMHMGRGSIQGSSMPMAALVQQLSQNLGRPVIDKTELTGNFNVKLEWTPESGRAPGGPPMGEVAPAADNSGPTLFTAVQEQLGLKLESGKGAVDMLSVEKIEKPTEN